MQPHVTAVTLGVQDLNKSIEFYKDGLGWPLAHVVENSVAFFSLHTVVLILFVKDQFANDTCVQFKTDGYNPVALAHNVGSEQEVDAVIRTAEQAGASVPKPAHKTTWGGYSGYFADPDNHLWEVAHNPFWQLDAQGKAIVI